MKKTHGNKANSKAWQTAAYKSNVARANEKIKMWGVSGKKRASEEASHNHRIAKMWGLVA